MSKRDDFRETVIAFLVEFFGDVNDERLALRFDSDVVGEVMNDLMLGDLATAFYQWREARGGDE